MSFFFCDKLILAIDELQMFEFWWHILDNIEVYLLMCIFIYKINLILIVEDDKQVIEVIIVYTNNKSFFMLGGIFRKDKFIAFVNRHLIVFHLID